MTMRLDENTLGVWYCLTIPHKQDFLLTLNRVGEKSYEITYRFRYYNSDDPFDEKDEKSWASAKTENQSEEQVIASVHGVLEALSSISGGDYTEILRGDRPFEKFMEEFMEQDFVHAKTVN